METLLEFLGLVIGKAIFEGIVPWQKREAIGRFLLKRSHMGVSINGGTPKWMVKIMENPIKIDDLGVPPFKETPICSNVFSSKPWKPQE